MSDYENLHGVIVGLGAIGNRHLQNLLLLGVGKMTVVRRSSSQNQQFKVRGSVALSHDLAQVLDERPNFAVICTPSHLHAATATQCLEAGVHVLIEKPLGRSIGEDEKRLIEVANGSDQMCAMAYCMRYHPAYRLAFEQLQSGAIGKCLYAKAWFEGFLPDWHPWEDCKQSYAGLKEQGGGVLRTLDHELDFMNWVLGAAESSTGSILNTGSIGIEADDLAMYLLTHPGGVPSQITTSFCRKPQSRGYEFVGNNGVISFRMECGKVIKTQHEKAEPGTILDLVDYDVNQMYFDMAEDFLANITGKSTNGIVSLCHGIHSLKLICEVNRID